MESFTSRINKVESRILGPKDEVEELSQTSNKYEKT